MANVAISGLSELTTLGAADLFIVTDDSESGAEQSKYIQLSTLRDYLIVTGDYLRPQFAWKDADEFYVGAGWYDVAGKFAGWTSQLTKDIGSLSASTQYYVYLDYSAITSGTAVTATEVILSSTAPTYSHTYRGWYNGSDRCIFAFKTDGSSNLPEFHQSGEFVQPAVSTTDRALADLDTTWTDVTLTIPGFCTRAEITAYHNSAGYGGAVVFSYWRVNGSSADGHLMTYAQADATQRHFNTLTVTTDSAQTIEVKLSATNQEELGIYTNGWYLPEGM